MTRQFPKTRVNISLAQPAGQQCLPDFPWPMRETQTHSELAAVVDLIFSSQNFSRPIAMRITIQLVFREMFREMDLNPGSSRTELCDLWQATTPL